MKCTSLRVAVPVIVACCWVAPVARAEDVVTTSGTRYDAREVAFLEGAGAAEGKVRFTYVVGGGSVTLELPMSRIDPWSLLALRAARLPQRDGRAQLELARFALAHGLPAEAERRFRRAAELDAGLAPERDAGLRDVKDAGFARALAQAEVDLKRGRSDLALVAANDVTVKADPAGALVGRARALSELATRMLETDRARLEAEAKARAEAAEAARVAAFTSSLARADQAILGGLSERGKASDPKLSASDATKALEAAESRLREGRRLLAAARPSAGASVADVDGRDKEALAALVATELDLADLYRQQRRFDRARDYLRAVQVLDPDNTRIKEIRELVERDLAAPPPQDPPPYDPFVSGVVFDGTYYGGTYFGSPCPCPTYPSRPRAFVTPGFRSGIDWRWSRGGFGIRLHW